MLTTPPTDSRAIMFTVLGRPRPQPRPRWVGGRMVSTADRKAKLWRASVERTVKAALADRGSDGLPAWLQGPIRLQATFMFETGKRERWMTPHTAKPDADNLAKPIMDLMERAGLLPAGDQRVVQLEVTKLWAKGNGAVVVMGPMDTPAPAPAEPEGAPSWLSMPAQRPRDDEDPAADRQHAQPDFPE